MFHKQITYTLKGRDTTLKIKLQLHVGSINFRLFHVLSSCMKTGKSNESITRSWIERFIIINCF